MSEQVPPTKIRVHARSVARTLKAQESPLVRADGDYLISEVGVWEVGDQPESRFNNKLTPTKVWLEGLVYACNLDVSRADLDELTYELGQLARTDIQTGETSA